MNAVRMEIQVFDAPPVVAIVESLAEANRLWARWARVRYAAGHDIGGCVMDGLRRCDRCRAYVSIRRGCMTAFGFFCSEDCGESEEHRFTDAMARQGFMTATHGEQ